MNKFWQHSKSYSTSADSQTSAGFHDGYVYKIISREDESAIQVDIGFIWSKPLKQCRIITGEEMDGDNQRFLVTRIQEDEETRAGWFQVQSIAQTPNKPVLVWDFIPHFHVLTQNPVKKDSNQLWYCEETTAGSRVYFIKSVSADLYLTNMGDGEPIALKPLDPEDSCQKWVLQPCDYST